MSGVVSGRSVFAEASSMPVPALGNFTVYVVILAYNEAASLPTLLDEVARSLDAWQISYHFVVVDDGSKDHTADVVAARAQTLPITLLRHQQNQGVAKAFDTGLRYVARQALPTDMAVTLEGDRTNDPLSIPLMVEKLGQGFDVVCASRYRPQGGYVGFPLMRLLFSVGANAMARVFFRVPGVRDYTIFFRAYRVGSLRRAVDAYATNFIECKGFASNAEILVKLSKLGPIRCAEVPTVYHYGMKQGKSTMRIWRNLKEYLKLFWRTCVG